MPAMAMHYGIYAIYGRYIRIRRRCCSVYIGDSPEKMKQIIMRSCHVSTTQSNRVLGQPIALGHLTYFLTRILRFWHFSSAAFIENNAKRVPMAGNNNNISISKF